MLVDEVFMVVNGVESPMVDGLTTEDLKYQDNISLVTLLMVARILIVRVKSIGKDDGTSSGVGCGVAIGDVEGEVLIIRTNECVLVFFCIRKAKKKKKSNKVIFSRIFKVSITIPWSKFQI